MEKFRELGLSETTLEALTAKGFEEPTEIQAQTIPLLLKNERNIIAQAQTGTGKTAAFALPLLEMLAEGGKKPLALIIAPTRELVIQICEEINSLRGKHRISVAAIYGGQSIELQLRKLHEGVTIVVGTPGRLLDLCDRGALKLDKIRFVILDEGDEMLNMGFIEDIEKILEQTPSERRMLLFSATVPPRISQLAKKYMGDYLHVQSHVTLTTNLTDQIYFEVAYQDKFEALCRIIDMEKMFYGIVFCRTKLDVDELRDRLADRGYSAEGLHGDISQAMRESILNKFRKQQCQLLIATDVAARGIDINNLTHVINYALPHDPEVYVHRIGRTGRAGNQGTAITFVTPEEFGRLSLIKRTINASIRKQDLPDALEIVKVRQERLTEEFLERLSNEQPEQYTAWAQTLLEGKNPQDILSAILQHAYGKVLNVKKYKNLSKVKARTSRLVEAEGTTRLFIARGRKNELNKLTLLDLITKTSGVPKNLIQNIDIHDDFSFITVPFEEAEMIIESFQMKAKGRRSLVVPAKGGKTGGGGERRGGRRGSRR